MLVGTCAAVASTTGAEELPLSEYTRRRAALSCALAGWRPYAGSVGMGRATARAPERGGRWTSMVAE